MKASFCTNAFGNTQEAIEEAIPQLAEMGYDGLEFWEQYLSGADLKWLKGFVDEHQLEIVQICPYFDFTTSAETWERSIRDAERYMAYAVELGGPFIRTYTGNVGGVEALIDVLADPVPRVRAKAAHVLGDLGDARAIEPLTATLQDEAANVRVNAIYAL